MNNLESSHREAVLTIAYRLMSGRRISLARLGELAPVHENARRQATTWYPPAERVVFDPARTRGEDEPPSAVDFLSRDIRNGLKEKGHARIEGLGVFSLENGDIRFTPSSDLQHVINHAYAHLDAHEQPRMKEGAFALSEEPFPVDAPEAPLEVPPTDPLDVGHPPLQEEPPPAPEKPVVEGPPSLPREGHVSSTMRDRRAVERKYSPLVVALIIALPLVAVGFYAAVVLIDWNSKPENVVAVSDAPADTLSVATENPAMVADSTASPVTTGADPPRTDVTALSRGMVGYTLITAATSQSISAAAQLESLSRLNLPSGVLYYDAETPPLYRAAIGQWPTAAAADSARKVLSGELPPGTWVKRLN